MTSLAISWIDLSLDTSNSTLTLIAPPLSAIDIQNSNGHKEMYGVLVCGQHILDQTDTVVNLFDVAARLGDSQNQKRKQLKGMSTSNISQTKRKCQTREI